MFIIKCDVYFGDGYVHQSTTLNAPGSFFLNYIFKINKMAGSLQTHLSTVVSYSPTEMYMVSVVILDLVTSLTFEMNLLDSYLAAVEFIM